MLAKGTVAGTVALIILIVLGLALAVASTLWVRDADPDPDIRYPWIGTRPDAGNADGRDHRRNRTGARPYHRLMDVHRSIFRKLVTYVSTTSA